MRRGFNLRGGGVPGSADTTLSLTLGRQTLETEAGVGWKTAALASTCQARLRSRALRSVCGKEVCFAQTTYSRALEYHTLVEARAHPHHASAPHLLRCSRHQAVAWSLFRFLRHTPFPRSTYVLSLSLSLVRPAPARPHGPPCSPRTLAG